MNRLNTQFGLFGQKPAERKKLSHQARSYPVHAIPNAIEISSGGGLFSLAAAIEGVDVQIHCEIDKNAVKTLAHNFEGSIVVCDILGLDPEAGPEGLDLFMGGPPCQPWSRAATLGAGRLGADDERNLWPEMLRLMESLEPRVVLLENVEGILDQQFIPYLGRPDAGIPGSWWQEAEAAGYEGVVYKLNAADYGSPQARIRVWMVLWPVGSPWGPLLRKPPPASHYDPRKRPPRPGMKPWVSALERFRGGCCQGYGLVTCRFLGNLHGVCDTCINGESFRLAPNEEGGGARLTPEQAATVLGERKPGLQRLTSEKPFDTGGIIAEALKAGDRGAVGQYLAPTVTKHLRKGPTSRVATIEGARMDLACPVDDDASKLRQLTVREAAKTQDVPQWYEFKGGVSAQYAQVGNGIAVNMGRAVIQHALRALRPSDPSPIPGTLADRQVRSGREGLWPFGADEVLCSSTLPISAQQIQDAGYDSRKDRRAARKSFPGGDLNRERRMINALVAGLEELSFAGTFEDFGWDDDEMFSLSEFSRLLTQFTAQGSDYGVPTEDDVRSALLAQPGYWIRAYPGDDDSWVVSR